MQCESSSHEEPAFEHEALLKKYAVTDTRNGEPLPLGEQTLCAACAERWRAYGMALVELNDKET